MTLLTLPRDRVHEEFFARGWTDGLPVIPPTPDLVDAMMDAGGLPNDGVLGSIPQRQVSVTVEQAAVSSVMAGCLPEYFPVVIAALSAMLDPGFRPHAAITTTGGTAQCIVVSGPIAERIGMNGKANALGSGNRANATIGRAVRLVAMNVLEARPGVRDASNMGHPGKYTFCFAEDPPPAPWGPLRTELGYTMEDTTVTVLAAEGPHQVANFLNSTGEGVLRTFAAAMRNPATYGAGKKHQVAIVMGPDHVAACIQDGWSREAVREFLAEQSRITADELLASGVLLEVGNQHDMIPEDDGKLPTIETPDDILLVTAGGWGAGWSAYIPVWAPKIHSRMTTRAVRERKEELPPCGPDGCTLIFDPPTGPS